jgi:hypothetical protein
VKHTGDGIMAAFDEVPNAVRAAVKGFPARTPVFRFEWEN